MISLLKPNPIDDNLLFSFKKAKKRKLESLSWYEMDIDKKPRYPYCKQDGVFDVVIIGGGFTGLSAAYHLAKNGINVALLEAKHLGYGASGRNGGQLGTGQRQWVEDLEKNYGFERTKILFDLAEQAKKNLLSFIEEEKEGCNFQKGHLSVIHRARFEKDYRNHIETMARYGYDALRYLDKKETDQQLGSSFFYGGLCDEGTGHLQPLKLVYHFANQATENGAKIFEQTPLLALKEIIHLGIPTYHIETKAAKLTARHVLIATNGYHLPFDLTYQNYVVPIQSYIGATESLGEYPDILPNYQSVDDSRFVVRYFRKTQNDILLFGGVEHYTNFGSQDIGKAICKQMCEIYPKLKHVKLNYYWGGTLGITVARMPFVHQLMKGVTYCGGYSGHGVMLAPFLGQLYAEKLLGQSENLQIFKELKISTFPGGKLFRPFALFLALSWFSLLDRL